MDTFSNLFNGQIRDILQKRVGVYPLYAYCLSDILNKGLIAKLEKDSILGISEDSDSGEENPRLSKIKPYLRNMFRRKHSVNKVEVLFISRYRPVIIDETRGLRSDYLFNPVIEELRKRSGQAQLKMALVSVGGQGRPYTDNRVDNISLFNFSSVNILLKSIFQSLLLHFTYKRIAGTLSSIQRRMFDGFFQFRSLLSCHLVDFCLDRAIRELDPKVIVANDDTLRFKPLVMSSSKMVVLQSASIGEQNERNVKMLYGSLFDYSLLSDCFCVSGVHSESVKLKFLKDTKKIVVTGQPRFDSLVRAEETFDRNRILKKLGIAADKKILLWITGTHSLSLDENNRNISTLYSVADSLKETQLVIKLHPAEDQEASLYTRNSFYSPIIVKGDQSVSEPLYVCDVMITKDSTTVIEAAILNKPIIILNLSRIPNTVPYVKEGVAIGAYSREDLLSTIEDMLHNEEVNLRLAEGRKKFVYEYAYIQDGKASERVAEVIMQMIGATGNHTDREFC